MLWRIAWFEIRFWLRSKLLGAFFLTITLLLFGASSSSEVMAELGLAHTYANAPFTIEFGYAAMGMFTLLMTAMFVNFAALRDVTYNTHALIFSTPVRRRDLLLGRFLGATVVAIIPMLGVSAGTLLAGVMPWVDHDRWMAVSWTAHAAGFALFAMPGTFCSAAMLFAVAVFWRRELATFAAAVAIFALRALTSGLFQDLRWESVRALLDPFGVRAFVLATKYWTVADKNTLTVGLTGPLLLNRVLWIAVGGAAFVLASLRFGIGESRGRRGSALAKAALTTVVTKAGAVPKTLADAGPVWRATSPQPRRAASFWPRFQGVCALHFRGIVKDPAFAVIATIAAILCAVALAEPATQFQGNETYRTLPVTYQVIELIRQVLDLFLLVLIAYFAGALVWKDRDERMDAILDATPTPAVVSYTARLAALVGMVMSIQTLALLAGIASQAMRGYERFQLSLYAQELLRDASGILFLAVLAFLIQVLSPNKYVGFFIFLTTYVVNTYAWPALNVASHLVQFASRPIVVYSDFFGDAPYHAAWNWFTVYWLFVVEMLAIATVMFWPRGREESWQRRRERARRRFSPRWRVASVVAVLGVAASAGFIWYNTAIINPLLGPQDSERLQAEYEKAYKPLAGIPQPRVRSVRYAIDLFPADRRIEIRGEEVIANPFSRPLTEVHFSLDRRYETAISIPGAVLEADDGRLSYRRYRFIAPLGPGEARTVSFTVKSTNRGFENELSNPQVVENGTFLSNLGSLVSGANYLAPIVGYDAWRELGDAATRKHYGLREVDLMPALERDCTVHCMDNYFPGHADWVDVSAVISTPPDQVAVAPGSLLREWQQGGRRYFSYRLDHPSMNVYFVAAARYAIARREWHGVKLEVYHLAEHASNVERMMDAMQKALEYCSRNFGPYRHKEARIVEFPRVANFAASFAGSMPFSEGFGFIADPNHRGDVDTIFFVVAHEVAHQWWDEQVIGANMEGATLLSETLAQYSALMVMEKEYGHETMRKLLRYEQDLYLRARGQERLRERPLLRVELRQFYVFYQKGGLALYAMREMIGEEAVNRALRKLVERYGYAPPPYPTAYALFDALRDETPPDRRYLLQDLFADITLFSNRTLAATATPRSDGRFEVALKVEVRKFKADGAGRETEVRVDDWIDVGAFRKPRPGAVGDDLLFCQRVHFTKRLSTFTFVTKELPDRAGLDPNSLILSRSLDANVKNVTLVGSPP
jgi:ABC-2 type transport system permease protein